MVVKYAYVLFVRDRRLPYVVKIDDIADLPSPRGVTDFKKEYEYSVKWDRSDRATGKLPDFYPAIIKCLGATVDEILAKVKCMRLKSPSMSLVVQLPSAPDDNGDLSDENGAQEDSSCISTTPAATQKSAFQSVQRKRMKSVLQGKERKEVQNSSGCSQSERQQKSYVQIVPMNERVRSAQSTYTHQCRDNIKKESKKAYDVNHNETVSKTVKTCQEVSKLSMERSTEAKASQEKKTVTKSGISCSLFAGTSNQMDTGLLTSSAVKSKDSSSWQPESAGIEAENHQEVLYDADFLPFGTDYEISKDCTVLYTEAAVAPVKVEATTSMSCEDDHESDEEVIADRIAKAITGEEPLKKCFDNQVYLGSGITINKETWEKRMVNMKKDSLFCNDLPQLIWGRKMMATRTLEGTKSKSKATPRKRKVCEAVFRGRLKARGISDQVMVDLLVEKTCKPAMKNSFYEASRIRKSETSSAQGALQLEKQPSS